MSVVKKRVVAGLQATGFVLLTLAAWWVVASIASNVVSCVPWAGQANCNSPFAGHPRLDSAVRIGMLVVSLFAAIWLGSRWFYAPDTYEPTDTVTRVTRNSLPSTEPITEEEPQKGLSRPQAVGE